MNREEMLLTQLSEECGELVQIISKIQRFGRDNICPGMTKTNSERLTEEFNDLLGIGFMLTEDGYKLSPNTVSIHAKTLKVERYLEFSKQLGTLTDD